MCEQDRSGVNTGCRKTLWAPIQGEVWTEPEKAGVRVQGWNRSPGQESGQAMEMEKRLGGRSEERERPGRALRHFRPWPHCFLLRGHRPRPPLTTLDPHPPLSVAYPQLPSPLSFQKQTQQTGAESLRSLVCQCPRAAVTSSCKLGVLKKHKLIWWLWAPEVLSELWALENPLPFLFQLLVTVPSPSPL